MWINGGKRYQFSAGRDHERQSRYMIELSFGWRDDAKEGEVNFRHNWRVSTRQIEDRLKRLQRWWRRDPISDYLYWPFVRWKWRTLMRLRNWNCERLGGHIYEPAPDELPYHFGRCKRCRKSQPW